VPITTKKTSLTLVLGGCEWWAGRGNTPENEPDACSWNLGGCEWWAGRGNTPENEHNGLFSEVVGGGLLVVG